MPKRRPHIPYSEEELFWIKSNTHLPRREAHALFCELFGRTDITVENYKSLCTRNGWKAKGNGRFPKGHSPANAGKKMPYNANNARTQFKKGQTSPNKKYLGHEYVDKDGYVWMCIPERNPHTGAATRYVHKHKYLWEKENGKVPQGMVLKCLDGNRKNSNPSNWKPISRGALPFLNGHRGYNYDEADEELRPAILALAELRYRKRQLKQ